MKNEIIEAKTYKIELGSIVQSNFKNLLVEKYNTSKKIILVDENTNEYCLEYLLTEFESLKNAEIILLPSGEENKVMEVCMQVWETFSEYNISRKDLIIALGGGVVCDMGGFIAAIYKRGLDIIYIPTTLLAMVDASIGGKTGVDLGMYKNQLGMFSNPQAIFSDPIFLQTLSEKELLNGFAEMLKHGLIASKNHWDNLQNIDNLKEISLTLIRESVQIKNEIVLKDPLEKNERKILNFGHTFAHAIEGFSVNSDKKIGHGHAVALGIVCEAFLSLEKQTLNKKEFEEIETLIFSNFSFPKISSDNFNALITLMKNDKKNKGNSIEFVLLEKIGKAIPNQVIDEDAIEKVLFKYFI